MFKKIRKATLILLISLIFPSAIYAQDKKKMEMPPARVAVSEVGVGMIAPEAEFVGTVYYQEVSDLASEVYGRVEVVNFEEGQRVKKGEMLVKIGSDILKKTLEATRASHEQILSDLEKAKIDFKRIEKLYSDDLISEKDYDEYRFRVKGLEKRSASLMADVERLEVELQKKDIRSPFDGVVLKRHVDRGEWLSPGLPVATIARDDFVDIVVDVPERITGFIKPGTGVVLEAGGHRIKGKVFAVIPRGDIATRTFPVKIRIKNRFSLKEGMGAKVRLPKDKREETLVVNRDAIMTMFGNTVVFAVIDSKAVMMPVKVLGYEGMIAGVYSERLQKGMQVVVKGNERIRDGQAVSY
ncbi:MAG: efflux RND transporter periplasmic adaptor subunit [Thermodesulfobacteriota bacterium]